MKMYQLSRANISNCSNYDTCIGALEEYTPLNNCNKLVKASGVAER